MKKTLKFILKSILGIIAFVLIYFLSAFCLSRITVSKEVNTKPEVAIYIKTNGVHTDLVVPSKNDQIDWTKEIKYANITAQDTVYEFLAMGWGDKGFYLQTPKWADLKLSVAFKATFALSTTAMHTTFYKTLHEDSLCRKIMISKAQYARLIKYINASFQKDANGDFIYIKTNAHYGKTDAFYEANGTYSLFYTCNTWANSGLKASGQKACLWTIFDTGIFLNYE